MKTALDRRQEGRQLAGWWARWPVLARLLIMPALLLLAAAQTDAQTDRQTDAQQLFRFEYREGEQYRILSNVDQNVFLDGVFQAQNKALNRIAVTIEEVRDGAGFYDFEYNHSLESTFQGTDMFRYGETFRSEFWRDERGRYTIDASRVVPPTRNVPILPEEPVAPGDTWTATGIEVFDLEFAVPGELAGTIETEMPVQYEYLGTREWRGGEHPAFSIRYNVFHRAEETPTDPWYPIIISGTADQVYYWDPDRGRPRGYEESYVFVLRTANGRTLQYEGTASSEVLNADPLDREQVEDDVQRDLEDLGVDDASVSSDEEGVTITLDNVRFPPDSALLVESEREKLRRISTILKKYPERDILITGHTALAGTEAGRQQLSEERAAAVGNFLIEEGVRDRERLLFRGMGARDPVADNSTEEGMRKNRRVEILIMEN
jgi:outer membrane protein OmpA-like peptidoglycan-associated protein